MTNIVILVGMPGSGKTYYIKNHYSDYVAYDDIMFFDKSKLKRSDNKVVFATPYFCYDSILAEFVKNVSKYYDSNDIEIIYFENDFNKCFSNIKKRNDGRKCVGMLTRLSRIYNPPKSKVIHIHN